MEQSFWDKLKRVRISDILAVFKLLIALPIAFFYKFYRKNIWLLCDTENEARDNAYHLFKYIRREHPDVDVVFAINKKSPDFRRVCKYGEVVHYGSLKHWIYYLAAEKNVSSQKMGKPNAAICYVLEVYGLRKNKRAFLQHGIITADLSFLYYEHTKMSLFVTSTEAEWKYVNENYHYPDGFVQKLGLCRFDNLHDAEIDKKLLLIMPTWRMYIRNEISAANEKELEEKFYQTDYYRCWDAILVNERFAKFVEENELKIVFYPHREMRRFLNCFHVNHPNISVASWLEYDMQELIKKAAYLITDYSSVAMDFAYMKKPLVYYQFDNEKFRQHHHGVGYFDFEKNGFGHVCIDAESVIDRVIKSFEHNFENEQIYIDRHKEYFDLYDANNCKRNYEAICRM